VVQAPAAGIFLNVSSDIFVYAVVLRIQNAQHKRSHLGDILVRKSIVFVSSEKGEALKPFVC